MNDTEVFVSKVDRWLLVVLLSSMVIGFASLLLVPLAMPGALATILVVLLLAEALPIWILARTKYSLSAETLAITCGPFAWRIRIAEISAIAPTRNPLSSPALSLDRLEIRYGQGRRIMISPADQAGFLRALEQRRHRCALARR
jgi:hypothetical protein